MLLITITSASARRPSRLINDDLRGVVIAPPCFHGAPPAVIPDTGNQRNLRAHLLFALADGLALFPVQTHCQQT
ncbi:unnamed protein product [Boreogadus saida]